MANHKSLRRAAAVHARHWIPVHYAGLVILALAVYANSLHGEFVFDDQQIVLAVRERGQISRAHRPGILYRPSSA